MNLPRSIARSWVIGSLFVCALGVQAQVVNLTNLNSIASINTASQAGLNSWTINGQQQMSQQWFWYGVGGPLSSINTLGPASINVKGANDVALTYTAPLFSLTVEYVLQGNSPGVFSSEMEESISILNTSANPLNLAFYKYSNYNLQGGASGPNTVTITANQAGLYVDALQTSSQAQAESETGAIPGAQGAETAVTSQTLNALNSGNAYHLDGNTTSGPGDVTSAFEWDLTINPGTKALLNTVDFVQIAPEPSSFALLAVGGLAVAIWQKRRARH